MNKELEVGYGVRDYMEKHLAFKTFPKPGFDVYEIGIYYKSARIGMIEVDGLELEYWRNRNNPDPDTYTYDELEKACEEGIIKIETPLQRKKRRWKEGYKQNDEETGWD